MSKTSEALRNIGIYNDHGLVARFGTAKKDDLFLSYDAPERARCGGTRVHSPSHQTDPKAHWQDWGCKSFTGGRTESLAEAQEWAAKTYGITEWSASPFSSSARVPTHILKAAKAALKGT